jgi:hypothetical protein
VTQPDIHRFNIILCILADGLELHYKKLETVTNILQELYRTSICHERDQDNSGQISKEVNEIFKFFSDKFRIKYLTML